MTDCRCTNTSDPAEPPLVSRQPPPPSEKTIFIFRGIRKLVNDVYGGEFLGVTGKLVSAYRRVGAVAGAGGGGGAGSDR